MDMPKPVAGHAKLERLAGAWQGEETMPPSHWDPEGGTALGKWKSRLDLGGFALITDYKQERDGAVTFTGHGVWTFDPEKELYSLHWFDCMGTPPEHFQGGFEGDVLTVAHGGPGMHARMTYEFGSSGGVALKMEMSEDGTAWNTLFEGRYQRA